MEKRHLLFPTIHTIACAMIISLFIVGLTSAQSPIDLSKEILVYIQPSLLDFPMSERGFVVPERLNIRSDALRQAVRQFRVQAIGKAFPDFSDADTLRVLEDGRVISVPRFSRIFRFQFGQRNNIDSTISLLSKIPGILFAEKNMDARLDLDDDYPLQWHLNNTGQLGGTPGEDIRAEAAWSIFTGSSNIRIGVIDSGVELGHDDLTGKSSGDSYTTGSNFPTGTQNHGTHVAGIAAASHNNIGKVRGVDANARIESRRIFQADRVSLPNNPDGYVGDSEAASKIISAVDAGSHILNNSWGGSSYSTTVRMAFAYAYKLNRAAVVAMGNNNSSVTQYPAGFGQGIIAVGATNNLGDRWFWNSYQGSNYGNHIDVAAPGDLIYSTITGNSYTRYTGTSMATPIVSGIASLLKGYNPNLYNDDIEQIIRISADDKGPTGWDQEYGTGRVNARKALDYLRAPYVLRHSTASGATSVVGPDESVLYLLSNPETYWDYSYLLVPKTFYGVAGLEDGTYLVLTYEAYRDVSFEAMSLAFAWGRGIGTVGLSNANLNFGLGWCEVVPGSLSQSGARLKTYVYAVGRLANELIIGNYWNFIGWYPTYPTDVSYNYTVLGIPTIQQLTADGSQLRSERVSLAEEFALYPNYPNPFNPETNISFSLPEKLFVTLKVYDVLGREVAELVSDFREGGNYKVKLDGSNLSSGIYFYKLTAGGNISVKKMLLIK